MGRVRRKLFWLQVASACTDNLQRQYNYDRHNERWQAKDDAWLEEDFIPLYKVAASEILPVLID